MDPDLDLYLVGLLRIWIWILTTIFIKNLKKLQKKVQYFLIGYLFNDLCILSILSTYFFQWPLKCPGRIRSVPVGNKLASRIQIRNSVLLIRGSGSERNIFGSTSLIFAIKLSRKSLLIIIGINIFANCFNYMD